jgi:ADP-ribose pyrophosphatase YjhB (NUDIX family)
MDDCKFVIRVYGIYLDPERGLLVSDEKVSGRSITKLPGGGLEYGESTRECLLRELKEETGSDFEVLAHFYTTDFFVESVFHLHKQVISIYYLVRPLNSLAVKISEQVFDFGTEGVQSFRFVPLEEVSEETFSLAIDRYVGNKLRAPGKM